MKRTAAGLVLLLGLGAALGIWWRVGQPTATPEVLHVQWLEFGKEQEIGDQRIPSVFEKNPDFEGNPKGEKAWKHRLKEFRRLCLKMERHPDLALLAYSSRYRIPETGRRGKNRSWTGVKATLVSLLQDETADRFESAIKELDAERGDARLMDLVLKSAADFRGEAEMEAFLSFLEEREVQLKTSIRASEGIRELWPLFSVPCDDFLELAVEKQGRKLTMENPWLSWAQNARRFRQIPDAELSQFLVRRLELPEPEGQNARTWLYFLFRYACEAETNAELDTVMTVLHNFAGNANLDAAVRRERFWWILNQPEMAPIRNRRQLALASAFAAALKTGGVEWRDLVNPMLQLLTDPEKQNVDWREGFAALANGLANSDLQPSQVVSEQDAKAIVELARKEQMDSALIDLAAFFGPLLRGQTAWFFSLLESGKYEAAHAVLKSAPELCFPEPRLNADHLRQIHDSLLPRYLADAPDAGLVSVFGQLLVTLTLHENRNRIDPEQPIDTETLVREAIREFGRTPKENAAILEQILRLTSREKEFWPLVENAVQDWRQNQENAYEILGQMTAGDWVPSRPRAELWTAYFKAFSTYEELGPFQRTIGRMVRDSAEPDQSRILRGISNLFDCPSDWDDIAAFLASQHIRQDRSRDAAEWLATLASYRARRTEEQSTNEIREDLIMKVLGLRQENSGYEKLTWLALMAEHAFCPDAKWPASTRAIEGSNNAYDAETLVKTLELALKPIPQRRWLAQALLHRTGVFGEIEAKKAVNLAHQSKLTISLSADGKLIVKHDGQETKVDSGPLVSESITLGGPLPPAFERAVERLTYGRWFLQLRQHASEPWLQQALDDNLATRFDFLECERSLNSAPQGVRFYFASNLFNTKILPMDWEEQVPPEIYDQAALWACEVMVEQLKHDVFLDTYDFHQALARVANLKDQGELESRIERFVTQMQAIDRPGENEKLSSSKQSRLKRLEQWQTRLDLLLPDSGDALTKLATDESKPVNERVWLLVLEGRLDLAKELALARPGELEFGRPQGISSSSLSSEQRKRMADFAAAFPEGSEHRLYAELYRLNVAHYYNRSFSSMYVPRQWRMGLFHEPEIDHIVEATKQFERLPFDSPELEAVITFHLSQHLGTGPYMPTKLQKWIDAHDFDEEMKKANRSERYGFPWVRLAEIELSRGNVQGWRESIVRFWELNSRVAASAREAGEFYAWNLLLAPDPMTPIETAWVERLAFGRTPTEAIGIELPNQARNIGMWSRFQVAEQPRLQVSYFAKRLKLDDPVFPQFPDGFETTERELKSLQRPILLWETIRALGQLHGHRKFTERWGLLEFLVQSPFYNDALHSSSVCPLLAAQRNKLLTLEEIQNVGPQLALDAPRNGWAYYDLITTGLDLEVPELVEQFTPQARKFADQNPDLAALLEKEGLLNFAEPDRK